MVKGIKVTKIQRMVNDWWLADGQAWSFRLEAVGYSRSGEIFDFCSL